MEFSRRGVCELGFGGLDEVFRALGCREVDLGVDGLDAMFGLQFLCELFGFFERVVGCVADDDVGTFAGEVAG